MIYVVLFLFSVITYLYFDHKAKYWKRKGVKGPRALPFIGNVLDYIKAPAVILEIKRYREYGRIYGTMQGITPVITVGEPELLKRMLISDFSAFINTPELFGGDEVLSKMIISLHGNDWKRMRTLLSPVFTTSKLRSIQPLVEECVQNCLRYVESLSIENKEFNTRKVSLSFTLNTVAECVFGFRTNSFENPNNEFIAIAEELATVKLWRSLTSALLPGSICAKFDLQIISEKQLKYFRDILMSVLNERRKSKTQVERKDLLSLLLGAEKSGKTGQEKLSDNELMAQCMVFFVDGYENVGSLLSFVIYILAIEEKVQEKLYQEISEYFQNHEHIEFDSLNSLPYLEAFLCECLRRFTPATTSERICGSDYKLGDTGITIEKGTILNIPFRAMYHDPELFPNPDQFIPERFLPENRQNIIPYSFTPFGIGPRICIGRHFSMLMMKLFVIKVLYKFEILKTRNTPEVLEYTSQTLYVNVKPLIVSARCR